MVEEKEMAKGEKGKHGAGRYGGNFKIERVLELVGIFDKLDLVDQNVR